MQYRTYQDLSNAIRRNVWKVPADIDLIVGVPRSGMIAALMLAELLNKPCATVEDLLNERLMSTGGRGRLMRSTKEIYRVLVIDDTVFFGNAMRRTRAKLKQDNIIPPYYDVLYACVFAEGEHAKEKVDIWFEDIYLPYEIYFYEWNILHHYEKRSQFTMWDIDGLLCKEPPDDRDTEAYEIYLPEAVPMIIPTTKIGAVVTYRLEKYRAVTEQWLKEQGAQYKELYMHPAATREQRQEAESPAQYKARIYANAGWATLFYESSRRQANNINLLTGKPVFCYENGQLYH